MEKYNYTIYGWMITDLKLSLSELLVYAVIYDHYLKIGFFANSIAYLTKYTGISRQGVYNALKKLTSLGYIEKDTTTANTTRVQKYYISTKYSKNT